MRLSQGSKPKYSSHYGSGLSPLILSGLSCVGSEGRITDCKRTLSSLVDCQRNDVAGVECEGTGKSLIITVYHIR